MAEASADAITTVPVHLEGITRVCFSPDGSTIFTGGTDCLVRIHNVANPDSEPGFHDNHTDAITSLTASKDHLITASADNVARLFTYPQNEFEGYVTRSPGVAIRWVTMDKAGEQVAVCSDDLLVKIVNVRDTAKVSLLSDNVKPVRSAAWDPEGKLLVTTGCDGKLKIYDTSGSAPACVKIMEGIIGPTDVDSVSSLYVAWHPSGNYFAVPLRTNDIGIIAKDGWAKLPTFSEDGHKSPVSELAWSPNGRYLASAAGKEIIVWKTDGRQVVSRYTYNDGDISGLVWSPKENLIAFTALDGSFNKWKEPVPASEPSPVLSEAAIAKKVDKILDDGLFGDDDDMLDDAGEDLGDDVADDWIVDDVGGYAAADDAEDKWARGRTEVVNVTKAQPSFVPGATEWRSKKRYLAFNMIGAVDVTDQETHNVVNVEFHDTSARRGYHFSDHNKYSMASLGEQGIAYAAVSDKELGTPSVVHYRPYDSWGSSSDWTVNLLDGEEPVAIAAGGPTNGMGAVVVATTRGFVRFFSAGGIQRYMWRLGEDVVTMVAGKESVLIIHREGGTTLDGCQNLHNSLLDIDSYDVVQEGRVPLPRKVVLTWAGFNDLGAPVIYDSDGLLSVLDRFRRPGQARWVPLFDAQAGGSAAKNERYWPVGVTNSHLNCIILKGFDKEPWFPRPLLDEVDLRMPLLGLDNAQAQLEENVARSSVELSLMAEPSRERTVNIDKELLQLVQGACKADQLARALDLTRLMNSTSTLDAAMKLATFYHVPGLQQRIAKVKDAKEREPARTVREYGYTAPRPRETNGHERAERQFNDFAPSTRKRSFAGKSNARAHTPQTSAQTFIPETPDPEDEYIGDNSAMLLDGLEEQAEEYEETFTSPPAKRKREAESSLPSLPTLPPAFSKSDAPKNNPFAKKPAAANPFAKTAVAKQLSSVKSTSFFDRVDDIEAHKPKSRKVATTAAKDGHKQTALSFAKSKAPLRAQDSMTETETEVEESLGVLEETDSNLQETLVDEPESL